MLAKRTKLFTLSLKEEKVDILFKSMENQNITENRLKWMNKKGLIIWSMMNEWLEQGGLAYPVLSTTAPPKQTAKEWNDEALCLLSEKTNSNTSSTIASSPPSYLSEAGSDDVVCIMRSSKNDLLFIDDMRISVLTKMTQNCESDTRVKKAQKYFQV